MTKEEYQEAWQIAKDWWQRKKLKIYAIDEIVYNFGKLTINLKPACYNWYEEMEERYGK